MSCVMSRCCIECGNLNLIYLYFYFILFKFYFKFIQLINLIAHTYNVEVVNVNINKVA